MSSLAPELGDAVRPDGTLKDASEIIWSYDADESIPFPLGSTHSILSTRLSPATMVGGVHRTSSRIHRPLRLRLLQAHVTANSWASNARRQATVSTIADLVEVLSMSMWLTWTIPAWTILAWTTMAPATPRLGLPRSLPPTMTTRL
jgi:hypothetical protein